jgi:hypothetical protein
MDVSVLERLVAEAEARERALLERTSSDDSHSIQFELREAVETLRALKERLYGGAGAGEPAGL